LSHDIYLYAIILFYDFIFKPSVSRTNGWIFNYIIFLIQTTLNIFDFVLKSDVMCEFNISKNWFEIAIQKLWENFFLYLFDSKMGMNDFKLSVYFEGKCSIGFNTLFNFVEFSRIRYPLLLFFINVCVSLIGFHFIGNDRVERCNCILNYLFGSLIIFYVNVLRSKSVYFCSCSFKDKNCILNI
jgi:hypothetical protein